MTGLAFWGRRPRSLDRRREGRSSTSDSTVQGRICREESTSWLQCSVLQYCLLQPPATGPLLASWLRSPPLVSWSILDHWISLLLRASLPVFWPCNLLGWSPRACIGPFGNFPDRWAWHLLDDGDAGALS
ncbi:hypothetical protein BDV09DRAFT_163159 [Aspergillus tetrazonus]